MTENASNPYTPIIKIDPQNPCAVLLLASEDVDLSAPRLVRLDYEGNGRMLFGKVPHIRSEVWFKTRGGALAGLLATRYTFESVAWATAYFGLATDPEFVKAWVASQGAK